MNGSYIKRSLQSEIERLNKLYSVVVITGPRQSGKTTLCRNIFQDYHYVNLEDIGLREQIQSSPKAFLRENHRGIIIDEVQHFPELLSYVQVLVDELSNSNFILTGSSNFTLMENVTQSLAGRSATLTLLPLSLDELGDLKKMDTDRLIFNGGYPAVWSEGLPVQDHCRNYYNTYVERDVRQLLKVKDLAKFQTFMRLCAGRIGVEFNASAFSNEVGVSVNTIFEWLSILEASYIVFRLQPYYKNMGKRLVKTPKLYFYDTSLACYLLGIEHESQMSTHPLRGGLFENLVLLEFFKNRFNMGKPLNLYFYRDKSQREVDIVQEFGLELKAYEIKSAKSFHKDFLKSLNYLKNLIGNNLTSTQVIYDGETDIQSPENGMVNFRNIFFEN